MTVPHAHPLSKTAIDVDFVEHELKDYHIYDGPKSRCHTRLFECCLTLTDDVIFIKEFG